MSTEKQIEANRRNAQKSTGPRTEEGRAAVRLNGIKHGLTAETLVLPGESQSEFHELLDSLEAEHRPTTPTEELLVRQMAMASWRLRRLYHIEAAFFAFELDGQSSMRDKYYPHLDGSGKLAYTLRQTDPARTLGNLSRYEARLERSFRLALQDLHRLRKQARTAPPLEEAPAEAPAPQIGFALPKLDYKEPAARQIGFAWPAAGRDRAEAACPTPRHPLAGRGPVPDLRTRRRFVVI